MAIAVALEFSATVSDVEVTFKSDMTRPPHYLLPGASAFGSQRSR